jgi:translation initiation factor 3 subunit C
MKCGRAKVVPMFHCAHTHLVSLSFSHTRQDDDDKDEWASDDGSSSSDDDGAAGAYAQLKGRARWLKKNTVTTTKVVKNKEERARAREAAKLAASAAAAHQEAVTATKSVLPEEHLTAALIQRRIAELAATRRGKDAVKQLRELEAIQRLSIQFGPRSEVPVTMYVISAQFALLRTLDDCMDTATWKSCAAYLTRIAQTLDQGYTLGVETVDASDMVLTKTAGSAKMKAAVAGSDSGGGGAMAAVAAEETLINPETQQAETADERAERVRVAQETSMTEAERLIIPVVGSLSRHLIRLEEEYTKSLLKISHHSESYIARLRDESKLVSLLESFQAYFERVEQVEAAAALAQLRVEHLYYRHDSIARLVDKAGVFYERYGEASLLHPACMMAAEETASVAAQSTLDFAQIHPAAALGKPAVEEISMEQQDFTAIMSTLCQYVYQHGSDMGKTRALVCQIYHHALHDRYTQARDLLLMSHLQETIYDCGDVTTMILFNRMMVTVGMCAFRLGRIHDAHQCLAEMCSGRVRELLAQGVNTSRFSDKTPEQEKAEKRRLVPYHQHINLDLIEACHLISAMLLEVPNMAGTAAMGGVDGSHRRHRVISRTFRKFLDQYNHQVFTGPPEQTRDYVMKAASALLKGDWKNCSDLVNAMDVWDLVPGEGAAAQIASMLTAKIKVEGLRTYLFAFSAQYDSLSLSQLCGMFALSKNEVHSVVSKMMINRDLFASWDQPTETIVLRKVDPSALQVLTLQFAEKAALLVEANERLLDSQSGSYGYKDETWKGDRDDRWRGGRGGGGNYRGGSKTNDGNSGYGGRGGGGRGSGRGRDGGSNGRNSGARGSGGGRGGSGRSSGRGGSNSGGGGRGPGRGGRDSSSSVRGSSYGRGGRY